MKRSILMLENDDDDRYITQTTFDENNLAVKLHFVDSSNDLFAFLITCEKEMLPLPALILLNHDARPLNAEDIIVNLRGKPKYAHIPIVVLSGIMNAEMIRRCYLVGANSVIRKPDSGKKINEKILSFVNYWFHTVELP
jgi:CheY-like chemotaxis protein